MEITCTAHEKRAWYVAMDNSHTCPFEEDCPGVRGESLVDCHQCMKERVVWHITDPWNEMED